MTQDVTVTNNVEKLIADLESRFVEKEKSLTEALDGLRGELKERQTS
jgi:hypothetical protein